MLTVDVQDDLEKELRQETEKHQDDIADVKAIQEPYDTRSAAYEVRALRCIAHENCTWVLNQPLFTSRKFG